jgi:hypothetical protein
LIPYLAAPWQASVPKMQIRFSSQQVSSRLGVLLCGFNANVHPILRSNLRMSWTPSSSGLRSTGAYLIDMFVFVWQQFLARQKGKEKSSGFVLDCKYL